MSEHDEVEIKIEYFESLDVDPLCEINQNKISEDSFTYSSTENTKVSNILNNESECDMKWYKYVDNSGKYACKYCKNTYSTNQTLRNHVRLKHNQEYVKLKNSFINITRKRKLKCYICKEIYKDTIVLQEHVRNHGIDNIKKSCNTCYAVFENESVMLAHMMNEHGSKNKLHICSTCGYSTSKLSHYKQHKTIHIFTDKMKCVNCNYSTNRLSNMKIHEYIHAKKKPYKCDYDGCDYRCTAKSGLYSHQLKHNRNKNMLYCDKCNYSTVYKSSLKKHIDSHSRNSVRKRF